MSKHKGIQNNDFILPGGIGHVNVNGEKREISSVFKGKGQTTITIQPALPFPPMYHGFGDPPQNRTFDSNTDTHSDISNGTIIGPSTTCPICKSLIKQSEYLASVIRDPRVLFLANMITHYRHSHISSWNKMWGDGGRYYRRAAKFGDYETEKKKVNERAKRQIIRKCYPVLLQMGITPGHFAQLQNTDPQTMAIANKFLR